MAGSQKTPSTGPSCTDPILAARLDAIKQLAGGVSERVAVMDRDFNVIYANESAWSEDTSRKSGHRAKCYEAFAHRNDPCGTCPATTLYESPEVQSVACSSGGDGTACGMHQAFPLVSNSGEVETVLVLFKELSKPSKQTSRERPDVNDESKLGELIGSSAAMREVLDMIQLVADSSATVLIQGESGTGKELVAKTIHQTSYRREKPFVVVDCGSLPEMLLESELFGHVKGAFTGAHVTKRGLFEEADGGTIFLDEIANTTPVFQAKLLRVLQEGEIRPVGGTQRIKIDARVISATNKDLAELVKAMAFRQDLYYRLAVLPLSLPPLRDRQEDIPLLAQHFVEASCTRHRQPMRQVSPDVMQALTQASWPGNVRELQHYLERAVVTTTGSELICEDIVAMGSEPAGRDLRTVARGATRQAERARILQALQQTGNNRAKAAKLLKISRASLYNKIRDYQIE
ncbi:MAG: sigma-54-dependent Fis family transcriptional regulator [Nitrospiraceae bacterium]|nr:MAG: sigma-54-dependent Fis family transcriptional regulator [Nitrospiraceae bacterium]